MSEEAAAPERGSQEKEEGGEGPGVKDGGRGGEGGGESEEEAAMETPPAPVYCVCRRPDINCFMIGCDSCTEWFHGTCIGISEKAAKAIRVWYCPSCREQDPSLEIKYRPKKNKEKKETEPEREEKSEDERSSPPPKIDRRRVSQVSEVDFRDLCSKGG